MYLSLSVPGIEVFPVLRVVPRPQPSQVNLGAFPALPPVFQPDINLLLQLIVWFAVHVDYLDSVPLSSVHLPSYILVILLWLDFGRVEPFLSYSCYSAPPEVLGQHPFGLHVDATPHWLQFLLVLNIMQIRSGHFRYLMLLAQGIAERDGVSIMLTVSDCGTGLGISPYLPEWVEP